MLLTAEQKVLASVLTKRGFYRHWKEKVDSGLTYERAYDETEVLHVAADLDGETLYSQYANFERWRLRNGLPGREKSCTLCHEKTCPNRCRLRSPQKAVR